VATVDLTQEFKRGAAGRTLALRVAQVVYTLTEDITILSVVFNFEGTHAPVISDSGRVLERPVGRKDYAGFAPIEEETACEASLS
jgi:spore germination protein GerM